MPSPSSSLTQTATTPLAAARSTIAGGDGTAGSQQRRAAGAAAADDVAGKLGARVDAFEGHEPHRPAPGQM